MRAGRLDAAESALRKALAHHEAVLPKEAPRSACYLATCLRLAGRARAAAAVTDDALAKAEKLTRRWNDAVTTQLYLHLERGRVRAALGMWAEAADDFARVCEGQPGDSRYPRLGAVRGLASALRALDRTDEADDALRACLSVARTASMPILRKVAAIAAGEALLNARPNGIPCSEIEEAWTAVFGVDTTPEHIAAVVRAWVY
jgi:hypothetical protein